MELEQRDLQDVVGCCVCLTAWLIEHCDVDRDEALSVLTSVAANLKLDFGVPTAAFGAAFVAESTEVGPLVRELASLLPQHLEQQRP